MLALAVQTLAHLRLHLLRLLLLRPLGILLCAKNVVVDVLPVNPKLLQTHLLLLRPF